MPPPGRLVTESAESVPCNRGAEASFGVPLSSHGVVYARNGGPPSQDSPVRFYSMSRMIVTGPSFTSETSILAPNAPVPTGTPSSRSASQNRS
jgi:hypothetical protein